MKEVKSKQSLEIKSKKIPAWLKQPVVRPLNYSLQAPTNPHNPLCKL